jgi:acetolactate synthase regulatory subunit
MQHPHQTNRHKTYCFSVRAEAEPSVLPRLLALFAKRGMVPTALHARCHDHASSRLQVDIEATGLEADLANYLQLCMQQIVGVELVLLSTKHVLRSNDLGPVARAG